MKLFQDIISILRRRPCTLKDISQITGVNIEDVKKQLELLVENNEVETEGMQRGIFYKLKE